jgi:hypothetical protein
VHGIPSEDLERAAELIANAEALLVAAGAGMGVDSGLPDFRGLCSEHPVRFGFVACCLRMQTK